MTERFKLICGDCMEWMAKLPEASVDAIVTDPPYGLEFMGKDWDRLDERSLRARGENAVDSANRGYNESSLVKAPGFARTVEQARAAQDWHEAWAREALRVLKPGGHLLAFGGTRTYHRLACAVEDAGFEIRDTIVWLYGSGFPKSLDVSKAIDKAAGAEREVVGVSSVTGARTGSVVNSSDGVRPGRTFSNDVEVVNYRTVPETPEAARWEGWGTALKPAHEPIVVARKPLAGTVTDNVLEHGTGAINVDACRVGTTKATPASPSNHDSDITYGAYGTGDGRLGSGFDADTGRWPANVTLDTDAAALLDEQSGERSAGGKVNGAEPSRTGQNGIYGIWGRVENSPYDDAGGASRFFYTAKASRSERNAGCDDFEKRPILWSAGEQNPGSFQADGTEREARNFHPTVKPVDLMRWLVRLVTPPQGLILDCFTGSGTTGIAALLEGFRFLGIEREAEYVRIAEARIRWWAEHPEGIDTDVILKAAAKRPDASQGSLF